MQVLSLPPLREDLQLEPGPSDLYGAPSWSIYDPVRNRYIRLTALGFEIIKQWQPGPVEGLLERLKSVTGYEPEPEEIMSLVNVLTRSDLFVKQGVQGVKQLDQHKAAHKVVWYKRLLHQYLFFKVPLLHPDRFLKKTRRYVEIFYQPVFYLVALAFGLITLFFLLREWSEFSRTIPDIFSFQNLLWGMAALGLSKVIHEFAHAYTAARLNCRIPTMGVAFMVMWPVLYTDMSDSWKLVRRRDRLCVASAGMVSELILALFATLLWTLLPQSGLKDGTFMLATLAWVMTLAVNLNPFMRFDGYYIFSDLIGVENLQDRSFAFGKWAIRKWFLDINMPTPEPLPNRMQRILIGYAFATWIYRFFLFLGIALLVYHMFFKALGFILFSVELAFFIAMPIWKELKVWWSVKDKINLSKPILRSVSLIVGVVLYLTIPWQQHVTAPALMRSGQFTLLYPPIAGQLESQGLLDGQKVFPGEKLFVLSSPDLEYDINQSQRRLDAKKAVLKRLGARQEETDRWQIIQREVNEEETRLNGLVTQREKLAVYAPHVGVIHDVLPALHSGQWLSEKQVLARLVNENKPEVLAYVGERIYHRIEVGTKARFISNDLFEPSVELKIIEVAQVNTSVVEHPGLIEKFGGNLSAKEISTNTYTPIEGLYKVRLETVEKGIDLSRIHLGAVSLEVRPESIIRRFYETVAAVIIRESGF